MSVAPGAPVIPVDGVEPAPKKRGMLMLLLIGGVVLGALGAGAWFFVMPKFLGTAHAKPAPPPPTVKATVPLGAVVVNLNGEARRYLRVGVSLGVADAHDSKEIDEHKSQLLDLLISVLSSTDVDELTSDEGKTELKDTLLERMHKDLEMKKVLKVYFTEFVIQ